MRKRISSFYYYFYKKKYYKCIINKSADSLWTTIFQKKIAFREIYYMFSHVTE